MSAKKLNASYSPPNRMNVFIVYELDIWSQDLNSEFALKDCLFEGDKLGNNADLDKYAYTGYRIWFDSHSEFSLPDGSMG